MKESIFTKIANREIPSYIMHEEEKYMAFLDINPAIYGQTLVIPKEWHDSYLFNNEDAFLQEFILYVKKVAKLIDSKLGSERCIIVFEGYGVDHLHARLYPVRTEEDKGLDFHKTEKLSEETAKEILGLLK